MKYSMCTSSVVVVPLLFPSFAITASKNDNNDTFKNQNPLHCVWDESSVHSSTDMQSKLRLSFHSLGAYGFNEETGSRLEARVGKPTLGGSLYLIYINIKSSLFNASLFWFGIFFMFFMSSSTFLGKGCTYLIWFYIWKTYMLRVQMVY